MHLYCMRHGEAYQSEVNFDQELTPQGVFDITSVANFLNHQSIHIDHIIHSGKLRSKQTADILAKNLFVSRLTAAPHLLNPNVILDDFTSMLEDWHEETLLVGHLPMIGNLVQSLTVGHIEPHAMINYQPGTLVCLKFCHKGHWLLDWVLHPHLCR